MSWHSVGKEMDFEEGHAIIVEINKKQIAVFKIQNDYFAIDNICPHRGGPLGEGRLEGNEVTCPWHAWSFNLSTGKCVNIPQSLVTKFNLKKENSEIYVEAP